MKRALTFAVALLVSGLAGAEPRNPLEALRLEDLSVTRDRPLFAPTRRPPPPPPRVEITPPPPVEEKAVVLGPPPFDLIGSVIGARESIALLRNKASIEVLRLRPGEEAEGWRVGAIGLRSVALERDGRKESLALTGPPSIPAGAEVAGEPQPPEAPVVDLKSLNRRIRKER